MTEAEKDAFIVQLRGEVTKYRDAYRVTKYQLDTATQELHELRKPSPTSEHMASILAEYKSAVAKYPKFCDSILFENQAVSWRFSEVAIKNKNSTPPYSADNLLMEEMAEAFSAYEQGAKRHALQAFAQCGAIVLRIMDKLEKEIGKGDNE